MKKIKVIGLLFICIFLLGGCSIKTDEMEDINIYTTIYPLNYLITYLYGNNATIKSLYPTGVNIDEYELSDKKLAEYSKSDLFVFNSLDKDRDYAVKMVNNNSDLKLIDVSLGMSYSNSVEELWLNPYNYLMMAQNVKDGLSENITNPYLQEEINNNYESLKYALSKLDANLKENINNAKSTIIIVDNSLFKYLEKYHLTIICLEENDDLTQSTINEAKKLINDGSVKYIYSIDSSSNTTVQSLIDNYGVELVTINSMRSIDGGVSNSNENYLTIMNNNIELLAKELYKS